MSGHREYLCYIDGSCKGGEMGAGGWGYVVKSPTGETVEAYGSEKKTLSKVMEYRAAAEAMRTLPDGATAIVFSDNESLVLNMSRNLTTWQTNAFAKVDPLVVASVRMIAESITERTLSVSWQWIRSHNGNAGNERADELATKGAREAKAEAERALSGAKGR